ncbi:hypothetical protein RIF29_40019 [Crotalaria pallida]|uniref:Uncharacterized protein n=1 Tax=Crotalaria pallida TaxID=3830 RepID=A0AAN9E2R7_CROPI
MFHDRNRVSVKNDIQPCDNNCVCVTYIIFSLFSSLPRFLCSFFLPHPLPLLLLHLSPLINISWTNNA